MRAIPAPLLSHIRQDTTTLAVCWRVERTDGALILGTEHDQDVTVSAGAYAGTYVAQAGITGSNVRSTSDMSVDNMEVTGAINQGDLTLVDLRSIDIESGLFDDASVVLFMCNWAAPDDGQIVLRTGTIGEIRRTGEGQYRTELRGLAQRLAQNFVRTYGAMCDAELGDARCKFNLAPYILDCEVTAVTSNRRFEALVVSASPQLAIDVELYLPMAGDIEVGDTFTIQPGCDKSTVTCGETYANLVNFRGHGAWCPGIAALGEYGGQNAATLTYGVNPVRDVLQRLVFSGVFPYAPGSPGDPKYDGGLVIWTSGANTDFSMEVKHTTSPA